MNFITTSRKFSDVHESEATSRGFYYNPFLNDTVSQEQLTVVAVMRQSDAIYSFSSSPVGLAQAL
jgi:hypothetical protein